MKIQKKKSCHTTTISSPPMRQTKNKPIRQKTQTEKRNQQKTEKQTHAERIIGKVLIPLPMRHLSFAPDTNATLLSIPRCTLSPVRT